MLLRPFDFAGFKNPLQKLTVLYAYSDRPMIEMELTEYGKEELDLLNRHYGKAQGLTSNHKVYNVRYGESNDDYEERIGKEVDRIMRTYSTVEVYKGQVVETLVEGEICKFYPGEYNVISVETFDFLLTSDEHEYVIDIEDDSFYNLTDIRNKLFYIRNRGIGEIKAKKMLAHEAKDAVIFRPQQALLEMFCREKEIY